MIRSQEISEIIVFNFDIKHKSFSHILLTFLSGQNMYFSNIFSGKNILMKIQLDTENVVYIIYLIFYFICNFIDTFFKYH